MELAINYTILPVLGLALLGFTQVVAADDLQLDTRSIEYISATQSLFEADQALNRVEAELLDAFSIQRFPGLDEEKLVELVGVIRKDLRVILAPESRRMEFQTVVPDGTFIINDNILER